jgi:TetR/AcrR family transcriptional regulator
MAATPTANFTPRAQRTRLRILEAAEAHFAARGFSATRLEDIAGSVGIRRAALFYYFRNKRDLYGAVLDSVFGGLLERLRSALGARAPFPRRIEGAVNAWVNYVGERPSLARFVLREGAKTAPERKEVVKYVAVLLDLLKRAFEEGERERHFRVAPVDPIHFASTIAGATVFLVAAAPNFVPDLPFDPISPEQLDAHRSEMLTITRRLLGIQAPRLGLAGRQRDDL